MPLCSKRPKSAPGAKSRRVRRPGAGARGPPRAARRGAGGAALVEEAEERFRSEVVAGTAAEFVRAKLAERDERHARMGDSRDLGGARGKDGQGAARGPATL